MGNIYLGISELDDLFRASLRSSVHSQKNHLIKTNLFAFHRFAPSCGNFTHNSYFPYSELHHTPKREALFQPPPTSSCQKPAPGQTNATRRNHRLLVEKDAPARQGRRRFGLLSHPCRAFLLSTAGSVVEKVGVVEKDGCRQGWPEKVGSYYDPSQ